MLDIKYSVMCWKPVSYLSAITAISSYRRNALQLEVDNDQCQANGGNSSVISRNCNNGNSNNNNNNNNNKKNNTSSCNNNDGRLHVCRLKYLEKERFFFGITLSGQQGAFVRPRPNFSAESTSHTNHLKVTYNLHQHLDAILTIPVKENLSDKKHKHNEFDEIMHSE
uniref:Uncharacterized protein n=1 Tax=Glossina austeni TaxID=7395 RepID=A0A1A9V870_GLOAU